MNFLKVVKDEGSAVLRKREAHSTPWPSCGSPGCSEASPGVEMRDTGPVTWEGVPWSLSLGSGVCEALPPRQCRTRLPASVCPKLSRYHLATPREIPPDPLLCTPSGTGLLSSPPRGAPAWCREVADGPSLQLPVISL